MYVCVCICMYGSVHVYLWRPEVSLGYQYSGAIYFFVCLFINSSFIYWGDCYVCGRDWVLSLASEYWTQDISLGIKGLYPLTHLSGTLFLRHRVPHWPEVHQVDEASQKEPVLTCTGKTSPSYHSWFLYVGSPHACMASTSPPEPSLQPYIF